MDLIISHHGSDRATQNDQQRPFEADRVVFGEPIRLEIRCMEWVPLRAVRWMGPTHGTPYGASIRFARRLWHSLFETETCNDNENFFA